MAGGQWKNPNTVRSYLLPYGPRAHVEQTGHSLWSGGDVSGRGASFSL
jgi:hypothetical protein